MAAIPKLYRKGVAEGGGILVFAIMFAITIRALYFIYLVHPGTHPTYAYLWKPLSSYLNNGWISPVCGAVVTAMAAFMCAHINTTYLLIRRKTILPPAIVVLLLSCHPQFIYMSGESVGMLLFLFIIGLLFEAYHSNDKQIYGFKTGFLLALGSLFTPGLLIYLPVLWVALSIMRCFNFKTLLATLVGVFIVYFPVFSFYLFTDNLGTFLLPFVSAGLSWIGNFPFLQYDIIDWIGFAFSCILLIIIVSDNYINRHKDKIKIRACLNLLTFIVVFAILACLLLDTGPLTNVLIALATGSLLISHFFALAEQRGTVVLFYACFVFYIFVCFLSFLSR
jgi:hypothetical protein